MDRNGKKAISLYIFLFFCLYRKKSHWLLLSRSVNKILTQVQKFKRKPERVEYSSFDAMMNISCSALHNVFVYIYIYACVCICVSGNLLNVNEVEG